MSMVRRLTPRHGRLPLLLVMISTLVLLAAAVTPARATSQNSQVFPPNANPYGRSLGEWGAEWWKWMGQYPLAENPITDDGVVTYGDADEQPAGPVWYLAGNFGGPGERWLDVPVGKSFLMPLINWDVWSPEDCWWIGASTEPDACSAEDLQDFLDMTMEVDVTDLTLTIDGQAVENLFDYRATSGPFILAIEPDTLWTDFGYSAGPRDPNLSDGYYVMIKPLSPGEHTVHFTADIYGGTFQDMTYHLAVE